LPFWERKSQKIIGKNTGNQNPELIFLINYPGFLLRFKKS
jgi:hypothetical protein